MLVARFVAACLFALGDAFITAPVHNYPSGARLQLGRLTLQAAATELAIPGPGASKDALIEAFHAFQAVVKASPTNATGRACTW